jgi:hypothetical protein
MLIGILLSSGRFEIQIDADDKSKLGYCTKLKVSIRGGEDFLRAVQRSLVQHNITSHLKPQESKSRTRPILRISGIVNMNKIRNMIPLGLPDAKNEWQTFLKAIQITDGRKHLTLEGFDSLLKLKGLI